MKAIIAWIMLAATVSGQIITSGINTATQTALNARRTYDNADFNFIMAGDSIFQGVTNGGATAGNYIQDLLPSRSFFSGRATIIDVAVAGRTIAAVVGGYATETYPYRPSNQGGKRAIYCVLTGTNEASATSANQIINAGTVLTHCAAAKADGFEVWLCTLLPRTSPTTNQWEYFNRTLRDGSGYDKLIDFNGLFRDSLNAALMGDAIHPTNAGYVMMANYINGRAWSDLTKEPLNFGSAAKMNADSFTMTGGSISGAIPILSSSSISLTSTGASNAAYIAQAIGAGSSRQWLFGHAPNAVGNTPANSFSLTHYNGTTFEQGLSGFRPGGGIIGNALRLVPSTVANLIATPTTNTFATVSDASAFTAGSTVTGGGSVKCMVQYDGSAWKMVMQLY